MRDAHLAIGSGRVHAMHDPTEGGLAMAVHELASAARVGVALQREQIPVLEEASLLCRIYGLDPFGTIASGALLIATPPEDAAQVQLALQTNGIGCAMIGRVVSPSEGVFIDDGGMRQPLPRFERDEISRLFTE